MDIRNGWYLVSFFFGAGCSYQTTVSEDGKIVAVDCDFNSQNGLAALKQMIALAKSQAFQQSTDVASQFDPVAGKAAAAVSGPWDAATVQRQLGDRYGVTVLPQMDLAGNAGQMSTWAGFKLMGVNPTQGEEAVRASHRLASYLTGETAQLERFRHVGWGPSNEAAQQSPEVAQDLALRALSEQMASSPAQPQCSSNFWKKLEALGTEVDTGTYDAYTDAQLQVVLDELTEYLKNDVER